MDRYSIDGIPVRVVAPDNVEGMPLVFYAHGLGGDKDARLELGYRLAEAGICYVAFDADMHGERADDRLAKMLRGEGLSYPAETQLDFYPLMLQLVERAKSEIDTLIGHFSKNQRIDADRIGMLGTSMGGCATFYVAANDSRIKVAVPMLASPYFLRQWQDLVLEVLAQEKWAKEVETAADETERISCYAARLDPSEQLAGFAPRPLLIMGGEKDPVTVRNYARDLYGKLRPLYRDNPDRLRLSIHKGVEHNVTPRMTIDACNWLVKHL